VVRKLRKPNIVTKTAALLLNTVTQHATFSFNQSKLKSYKVVYCIALREKPIAELRSVTCHMISHNVTCHPTQVNAPRLNPMAKQAGTRFTYLGRMEG